MSTLSSWRLVAPTTFLALVVLSAFTDPAANELQIHYVSVGQGDAAVAVTPNGSVVAFDAGPAGQACDDLTAYYASIDVTSIDYMIVSHYDSDSIGCVPELLSHYPVTEQVIDRGGLHRTQTFRAYKAAVGRQRKKARVGRLITLKSPSGGDVTVEIVAANGKSKSGKISVPGSNQNDRGVVAVLRSGSFDATFGGDIGGTNSGAKDVEAIVGSRSWPSRDLQGPPQWQ